MHSSQWVLERPNPRVEKGTPELREWVRKLTEDPASGATPWLERRKSI